MGAGGAGAAGDGAGGWEAKCACNKASAIRDVWSRLVAAQPLRSLRRSSLSLMAHLSYGQSG